MLWRLESPGDQRAPALAHRGVDDLRDEFDAGTLEPDSSSGVRRRVREGATHVWFELSTEPPRV